MATRHLIEAFNQAAGADGRCNRATMAYERLRDDKQWQVLTFYGTKRGGEAFELEKSVAPGGDVLEAAKKAGLKLKPKEAP